MIAELLFPETVISVPPVDERVPAVEFKTTVAVFVFKTDPFL